MRIYLIGASQFQRRADQLRVSGLGVLSALGATAPAASPAITRFGKRRSALCWADWFGPGRRGDVWVTPVRSPLRPLSTCDSANSAGLAITRGLCP